MIIAIPTRAITKITMMILIVTAVVVILVGAYATLTITGSGEKMTCSENTSTFAVLENGTTTTLDYPVPANPCQHHITLENFTLNTTHETSQIPLSGTISVDSYSQLVGLILYVNGTYELYNAMVATRANSYSFQYSTLLNNTSLAVISGMHYSIEFVGLFKDGTATTTSTIVAS